MQIIRELFGIQRSDDSHITCEEVSNVSKFTLTSVDFQ